MDNDRSVAVDYLRTTGQPSALRNTLSPPSLAPPRPKCKRLARKTPSLKTSEEHPSPGEGVYREGQRVRCGFGVDLRDDGLDRDGRGGNRVRHQDGILHDGNVDERDLSV